MVVKYHSTNNHKEVVGFEDALLNGMASNYGLYMIDRKEIPKLSPDKIQAMRDISYAEIAFEVLNPFVGQELGKNNLRTILNNAYNKEKISTKYSM